MNQTETAIVMTKLDTNKELNNDNAIDPTPSTEFKI